MKSNFGVRGMNVINSIVEIPMKDYVGHLTLKIVRSNVGGPIQSCTTKKLTNLLLESEWN